MEVDWDQKISENDEGKKYVRTTTKKNIGDRKYVPNGMAEYHKTTSKGGTFAVELE